MLDCERFRSLGWGRCTSCRENLTVHTCLLRHSTYDAVVGYDDKVAVIQIMHKRSATTLLYGKAPHLAGMKLSF